MQLIVSYSVIFEFRWCSVTTAAGARCHGDHARDMHAVIIRRTVNAEYRFLRSQQASSTYEVNFKTGRMLSWKAIISFRRESNAVVMHGCQWRHETVGVARKTRPDDNLLVTEMNSDRRVIFTAVTRRVWRFRDAAGGLPRSLKAPSYYSSDHRQSASGWSNMEVDGRTVLLTSLPAARLWLHCVIVNWPATRNNLIIH